MAKSFDLVLCEVPFAWVVTATNKLSRARQQSPALFVGQHPTVDGRLYSSLTERQTWHFQCKSGAEHAV